MAQENSPAFQWYAKDWVSGRTRFMSLEARGAYIDLLSYCWLHNGLPTDLTQLAMLLGEKPKKFSKIWEEIKHFWVIRDGKLFNVRLELERDKQANFRRRAQDSGKKSVRVRKAKFGTAQPSKVGSNDLRGVVREVVRRSPEPSPEGLPNSPSPSPVSVSGSFVPTERVPKEPAPTREFLKWFESEYPKRLQGAKYVIRWEKDASLARSLLAVHGPERLRKLAVMLLVTDEEWVQGTDRGIGILSSKINWLETRLAAWEARHGPTQAAR